MTEAEDGLSTVVLYRCIEIVPFGLQHLGCLEAEEGSHKTVL